MKRPLILLPSCWLMISPAAAAPWPDLVAGTGLSPLTVELSLELAVLAVVLGLILYLRSLLRRRTIELHASEERFRRLFEDAVEGIYENLPGGGFRFANPAMARILGYTSVAELIALPPGRVAACYVSPNRREEFFALLEKAGDHVTDFESEIVRPDGSKIWISENVRAVREATGRLLFVQGLVTDITARKRAEVALRESKDRWRLAVLGINAGIWENNLVTGESFYSDRSKEMLGFAPHELSNRREDWISRIHPDDAHLGRTAMEEHIAGRRSHYYVEHRLRCRDGSYKWILARGKVQLDEQGRPLRLVGAHSDISERKNNERALRESESRYRQLFENSPIEIIEYDYRPIIAWMNDLRAAGVADLAAWADAHAEEMTAAMRRLPIVGMNAAALRLVGAKTADEVMANLERIVSRDGWLLRRKSFLAAWSGRNESEGEMTLYGLDGSAHHVHAHWWVPVVDGRPFYERTPIALLDLTPMKAAELELAAERERMTVMLRAMAEGVVTTDFDGKVRFINEAACVITGWTSAAAAGRRIEEVCVLRHEKTGVVVTPPVVVALAAKRVVELPPQTTLLRRIGGRTLVEGCCAPMCDAAGQSIGTVLVMRDVTERSRLEAELQRASKLESIGILAGGIAHDFNNILAVVMGNLTLAQLDPATSPATLRWLKEAERGAFRARDLTQQLLTFAKGGEPVRLPVLLADVVREAAEFALHGSNVRAEYEVAADLWAADVDGSQIGQVVQNLVINAMQAMGGGGVIRIALGNEEFTDGQQPPLAAGRYLRLSLADNGSGIRPELLARIFEPYFTTKEQGTGLGLATVYSIIRRHQGHVAVESELGKGTRFQLWLPAAKHAPPVPASSGSPFEPMQGRVLFMDDEEPIRQLVDVLLVRLGLTVKTVADGAELLREFEAAREAGQPFDLVMMDLTVPGGMGGREAMQKLRQLDPRVRAIVSSGYSGDPVLANFRAHGFCGIVPKPYRVADLAKVLRTALAEK